MMEPADLMLSRERRLGLCDGACPSRRRDVAENPWPLLSEAGWG